MHPLADSALRGSLAGAAATLPMSAAMYAAKKAGLMGEYPPVVIADTFLDAVGVGLDEETDEVVAALAHLGFGASVGALFGIFRRYVRAPVPPWAQGMAYGLAVYTVSYNGWIPAVHILPEPEDDRPGRQPSMAAAHLVFGAALGILLDRSKIPT